MNRVYFTGIGHLYLIVHGVGWLDGSLLEGENFQGAIRHAGEKGTSDLESHGDRCGVATHGHFVQLF